MLLVCSFLTGDEAFKDLENEFTEVLIFQLGRAFWIGDLQEVIEDGMHGHLPTREPILDHSEDAYFADGCEGLT